ncbi:hypothetical protein EDC39_1159 [Geothermobacter ehrlichii]|uniref:Uncharacterized protein n=1 Tax=Geothermobacter ehrlichii TaxID=213224 RepID=A0A5D3WHB0_9BACT|nr:tetratricopeptide repeat protein [Geothermobacter ehrlichii]TYO96063.1 hypothetical protein EDC39_1159 [Geothermobacter ehrlichii]
MDSHLRHKISLLGGCWLAFFLLALRPLESFDTFWQLQSGKYIFQTGQFLYRDTFSLAADVFRLEHCWLHDLVLYLLHGLGGYALLVLFKAGMIAACGVLLLGQALRRQVPAEVTVPVLLLCLVASADSWLVRPQLWTFLFSVLYLGLLYAGRKLGWRAWIWLVPLMLLWANLHAACIFGFALLAAFGVGELWRCLRRETNWRQFGVFVSVALAVFGISFVNPYSWRIPLGQLAAHLDQTRVLTGEAASTLFGNMEWLPPTFAQVPLFYLVMVLWALLILLRLPRRQCDVAELVFFLGFAYMGFSQIRHTTLVALLAGFFLPPALWQVVRTWFADRLESPAIRRTLLVLSLVLLVGLPAMAALKGRLGLGLKAGNYPVAAADFLLEKKLPGNIYNAYDWGGYLMWRLFPDYLVFVDGRSDSREFFDSSTRIENGLPGWRRDLDRYGVNTIITRTCFYDSGGPQNLISNLVRQPGWTLVYRDEVAVIFVRDVPASEKVRRRFGLPSREAYRTMLAEARRLQQEGYPRPRAWLAIGRASYALGDKATALVAYRRYLQAAPQDREARMMVDLLGGGRP